MTSFFGELGRRSIVKAAPAYAIVLAAAVLVTLPVSANAQQAETYD